MHDHHFRYLRDFLWVIYTRHGVRFRVSEKNENSDEPAALQVKGLDRVSNDPERGLGGRSPRADIKRTFASEYCAAPSPDGQPWTHYVAIGYYLRSLTMHASYGKIQKDDTEYWQFKPLTTANVMAEFGATRFDTSESAKLARVSFSTLNEELSIWCLERRLLPLPAQAEIIAWMTQRYASFNDGPTIMWGGLKLLPRDHSAGPARDASATPTPAVSKPARQPAPDAQLRKPPSVVRRANRHHPTMDETAGAELVRKGA